MRPYLSPPSTSLPRAAALTLTGLLLATAVMAQNSSGEDLDRAFEGFWKATKPGQEDAAIADILALDAGFDEIYAHLRAGRPYSADVKTGVFYRTRKYPFHYTVVVPESYDPARRYPVIFVLHGGVARPRWEKRDGSWWRKYADDPDQIAVYPAAWNDAMWWQDNQAENLAGILRALKRDYNVDENRVAMLGVSDGGTGAYFYAFRAPTPWASFLPLIGHAAVLANASLRVDGQMYVPNLANRPLFVVNAGKDHLYPSERVRPYIDLFRRGGAEVEFIEKPDATHGMRWWPEEEERAQAFIDAHARDPLPDRIVWETERTDRYHRCDWLLVTELGAVPGESDLPDLNDLGRFFAGKAFPHDRPSGRVVLERRGNLVEARTRGVRSFRLLLSPDEFDFEQPVTITVNGRRAFRATVERDAKTLLRWAVRDQDRTTLFAAELEVLVPRS